MRRYALNRILASGLIVWGVLTLTFLLIQFAPGDPASIYLKPEIDPKTVANIRREMGLNLPIWKQYFVWLAAVARGNFGVSFIQHRPVAEILREALPNTLQLTGVVFLLQLFFGVALGALAAIERNSRLDTIISGGLLFVYSMPGFWLALIAILVFSLKLGWLPSSQMATLGMTGGGWTIFVDRLRHLILPALVLAAPFTAATARFVRNSLSDALSQKYIRTAMAYGLSRRRVLFKYALKNALLPLSTLFGLNLPFLLGGSVVIEHIFAWPGLGRITVAAIMAHDFPVILASTFVAALSVVVGNQLSDLLYLLADPRIRDAQQWREAKA